ncbi:hypothetical protein XELAEV_18009846mg [Xenopus laevis]|uniref:Uncharacterized protein n=1 Tax=Xenopus laevis TaxID=8355 RepID=A0A974DUS2_XENLA|nr:hypothetical protein XELAEV_18009846mg [Xenopus laevis]
MATGQCTKDGETCMRDCFSTYKERTERAKLLFGTDMGKATATTEQRISDDSLGIMMDLFKKFQKLSLKELKVWWEISTLENYIEVERVPRGLRLKKFPAFDLQDTDVMQEWYLALSECSFNLMGILIRKYKKEQNRLNIEIEEIKGQLNAYQSMPEYKEREIRMKEELETMEKKIMDNKQQKFLRDKVDYENERIYSWGMELNKERGRWERIRPILKQNKWGRQPKRSSTPVRDMDETQGVTFLVTTDSEIETSRE